MGVRSRKFYCINQASLCWTLCLVMKNIEIREGRWPGQGGRVTTSIARTLSCTVQAPAQCAPLSASQVRLGFSQSSGCPFLNPVQHMASVLAYLKSICCLSCLDISTCSILKGQPRLPLVPSSEGPVSEHVAKAGTFPLQAPSSGPR